MEERYGTKEYYYNTKPQMDQAPRKPQDQDSEKRKIFDIRERTLEFSLRVIDIAEALPKSLLSEIVRRQLMKSGTSIGANVQEADGSVSKKDFINKASIARKEARETKYWLRILDRKNENIDLSDEIQEVQEIIKILSAMITNTKNSDKAK